MEAGLISVLVTVRNGERYIAAALDSLLAQTDAHFEVIAVDDGSTDGTSVVLAGYHHPRLQVSTVPPVGRVPALLEAVRQARGEFFAILDGDDVALPERLSTQRAYLDSHPEVALCGTGAILVAENGETLLRPPTGPARVRRALGMYNPFVWSSVLFRREVYERVGGFRAEEGWGYDLAFLTAVAQVATVDILPLPLVRYRRHPAQVSSSLAWERDYRPQAARLQLRAAWKLGLPWYLWVFPLLGWLYASLPCWLRPVRLKQPVKEWLLRLFGIVKRAEPGKGVG